MIHTTLFNAYGSYQQLRELFRRTSRVAANPILTGALVRSGEPVVWTPNLRH